MYREYVLKGSYNYSENIQKSPCEKMNNLNPAIWSYNVFIIYLKAFFSF